MILLSVAIAPVLIIAFYIYSRDKYEKEPVGILLKTMIAGIIITFPVILTENLLDKYSIRLSGYVKAAYDAFIIAGFTEETFKFGALVLLIWSNKNFNEFFDGIVYAVFASLGFAMTENILFVFSYGMNTGILRAFTAVPVHALLGITMGYYFSLSKFGKSKNMKYLFYSLIVPVLLHGIYDFIVFTNHPFYMLVFVPYIIFLWIYGFKKMKELSLKPYKTKIKY